MVVYECGSSVGASEDGGEEDHADHHVDRCRSLSRVPAGGLGASSDPPAVEIDEEDDIIHEGVGDSHLDSGNHCGLLLAALILFPRATVLFDHADQLDVASHDGRDRGDQAGAEEEIRHAGDVKKGCRGPKAACEEFRLDVSGS